jgi:hypothetical protein
LLRPLWENHLHWVSQCQKAYDAAEIASNGRTNAHDAIALKFPKTVAIRGAFAVYLGVIENNLFTLEGIP